jgi:hypothetical protein
LNHRALRTHRGYPVTTSRPAGRKERVRSTNCAAGGPHVPALVGCIPPAHRGADRRARRNVPRLLNRAPRLRGDRRSRGARWHACFRARRKGWHRGDVADAGQRGRRPRWAATELDGHSIVLFIEVADLDAIERRLDGIPLIKARHRTFYGSTELHGRDPADRWSGSPGSIEYARPGFVSTVRAAACGVDSIPLNVMEGTPYVTLKPSEPSVQSSLAFAVGMAS